MAEQTLGDRDERLAANFDGTEFTECFPTSQGVSFRSKLGTAASRDVTENPTDTTSGRLLSNETAPMLGTQNTFTEKQRFQNPETAHTRKSHKILIDETFTGLGTFGSEEKVVIRFQIASSAFPGGSNRIAAQVLVSAVSGDKSATQTGASGQFIKNFAFKLNQGGTGFDQLDSITLYSRIVNDVDIIVRSTGTPREFELVIPTLVGSVFNNTEYTIRVEIDSNANATTGSMIQQAYIESV